MHLSGVNPKGGFSKIMYNQAYRPNTNAYGYPMYSPGPGPTQPIAPMGATIPSGSTLPGMSPQSQAAPGLLPLEQSYIENILRLNLGKVATIYMTFENNSEWNAKVFRGRLEAAGRDHIIISDPTTGMRYLLLMVNLDYITFDEELNYTYPFGGGPTGR